MSGTTLKARAKKLLSESLTPALAHHGFKKERNRYVRPSGGVAQMVDVQYSRWNDKNEVSFTLNCSVYVPGVTSTFRSSPEPPRPALTDCCVTIRVGMLTQSNLDKWWKLTTDDDLTEDEKIGRELSSLTDNVIVPFFERVADPLAVAKLLSEPTARFVEYFDPRAEELRAAYAAIIWRNLGETAKCRTCISRALELSKTMPLEDVIGDFSRRFTCG